MDKSPVRQFNYPALLAELRELVASGREECVIEAHLALTGWTLECRAGATHWRTDAAASSPMRGIDIANALAKALPGVTVEELEDTRKLRITVVQGRTTIMLVDL